MTTSVIKQIVKQGEYGTQTIKMVVKSNERGPRGMRGEQGIQGVPGIQGPRGADGSIHYQAGIGITISEDNVIEATGDTTAVWGGLRGNIQSQTDLQEEFNEYTKTENLADVALSGDYGDLLNQPAIPTVNNGSLTIVQNGSTLATFTANSSTNASAIINSPVITMTTTDPGEGSVLPDNNFIGVYGDEPIVLDYSTAEVDTGTKWINGESIYRKTINLGNLPDTTTKNITHNISNFETLVKLEGSFTNGTNSASIPYAAPTATKSVQAYVDTSNVVIGTGEDRSSYTGYVTLYYTKSS
jgi:hypothetical protein